MLVIFLSQGKWAPEKQLTKTRKNIKIMRKRHNTRSMTVTSEAHAQVDIN
jgi:hypothetical protein